MKTFRIKESNDRIIMGKQGDYKLKLVNYRNKNSNQMERIGFILDEYVVDVQDAYKSMLQAENKNEQLEIIPAEPDLFFKIGTPAIERAIAAYDFVKKNQEELTLLRMEQRNIIFGPPIRNPQKIICVGRNYAAHAKEMDSDIPTYPVLFAKFANALIGPNDPIEKTSFTEKLDYEGELVVVIGKEAKHVKREDAHHYISGYAIGNDTSARDLQKRTPQWLQGKSIDRTTPIGPWIVTTEEIKDPINLAVRSYVNGELRQEGNTRDFIFDVPTLIEFITSLITLQPGDLIMTGTPDGVGFGMNPPQFLSNGDIVTIEIDKIGKIENKVMDAQL